MYYSPSPKNPLGIVFLIVGAVLFFGALGDFLLRLLIALLGMCCMIYGMRLWRGHSAFFSFRTWRL